MCQKTSFVVLFKVCLGQARGLDCERFSALLCINKTGKAAHTTENQNESKSDTHKRDYRLLPLDAAATRTIS